MRGSDDRKRAQEAKFAMDEEERFLRSVRAAKRLGVWAAQRLGMPAGEAQAFATEIGQRAVVENPDDTLAYVAARLSGHETEAVVRKRFSEIQAEVNAEV